MPVKNLKETRKGIGFGGPTQDTDEEIEGRGVAQGASAKAGLDSHHQNLMCGSKSPKREDFFSVDYAAAPIEEEYFRIGSIYDEDAKSLRRRQEERLVSRGPWLGSFDVDSMQKADDDATEPETNIPWWEEDGESDSREKCEVNAKRRRLMQKELETHVFQCGGVLGLKNKL
jgi:hypothetical protein